MFNFPNPVQLLTPPKVWAPYKAIASFLLNPNLAKTFKLTELSQDYYKGSDFKKTVWFTHFIPQTGFGHVTSFLPKLN